MDRVWRLEGGRLAEQRAGTASFPDTAVQNLVPSLG
jgi:hypothetical protein